MIVWARMSINGRTDLYIFKNGAQTDRGFRDKILRPIVFLYAEVIGDEFEFIDDNAKPHHDRIVDKYIFEEGILQTDLPTHYTYMNPTEQVWGLLGRRVIGRLSPVQAIQ